MTEEEEFEFRARLEREKTPPSAPQPTGGAAFGIAPKQRAVPSKPETQERMRGFEKSAAELLGFKGEDKPELSAGKIAGAGAVGAGLGAAAPSALRTAGRAVGAIPTPVTRGAGALMTGLGTAMQAVPGVTRAGRGAALFGGAEAGGQVAQKAGLPPIVGQVPGAALGSQAGRVGRFASEKLLGAPSATSEQYARAAENLGFRLSPAQVKQDVPIPSKGSTFNVEQNQRRANELASAATGETAPGRNFEISPDFVRGRLRSLGNQFNELYQGRTFNIDQPAVDAIREIGRVEAQLPTSASVSAVRNTANRIVDNFVQLANRPGARPNTFGIEGDALQRLRTDLLESARASSSRQDAHQIYELVDVIDQSIARNHPDIAARLAELRPQYRNTIILEDLVRNGGIQQGNISLERLGNMLGSRKGGVRTADRADIDQLGEMGRQLRLRARWEPEGAGETPTGDLLKKALGTTLGGVAQVTGMRSRPARAVQRYFAEPPAAAPNVPAVTE